LGQEFIAEKNSWKDFFLKAEEITIKELEGFSVRSITRVPDIESIVGTSFLR
jgi:hypothetical protein